VGGLSQARVASVDVGGPDMAPHTPPRSERPGKPVALLDQARVAHCGAPSEPSRVVIVIPPSMISVWPVTQRAWSLAR
jgi:hypothetical protein